MMQSETLRIVAIVLISFVWQNEASSSEPGPEDCMKNMTITNTRYNNSIVYVPNEILCFNCTDGVNVHNFSINDTETQSSDLPAKVVIIDTGYVLSDILVVFDAKMVFNSFLTSVKCIGNSPDGAPIPPEYHVRVSLYDLNPPLVEKESTTITEGGTVNLRCDGSNSIPQPSLKWISPNGTVISETGHVEIVNITESEAGLYTCIATLPSSNSTTNSTLMVRLKYSIPVALCKDLSSTDSIIVNMTSATVGSTATYQCRAKLYSTQCTSQRVWDPDPLISLNCPEIEYMVEQTSDGMVRPYRFGVIVLSVIVLVQTLLLVGTTAKIILLVKKKGEEKTKEEKLEMNMNEAYAVPKHVIAYSAVR